MEKRKDPRIYTRTSLVFQEAQPLRGPSGTKLPVDPITPAINHTKHRCTDVPCLLIFVCFIFAWFYIAQYAWTNGNLDNVLIPTDSLNRKCGMDSGVRSKKHLFFFDLDKCLDPLVPITGCKTKTICVESCPQQTFFWGQHMLNTDMNQLRKLLICDENVDKSKLATYKDVDTVITDGRCSGWYLKSSSLLNHCVPFADVDFCQLVPNALKSRNRRSTVPELFSESLISVDDLLDGFAKLSNRTKSLCASNQTDAVLQAKVKQNGNDFSKMLAALINTFGGPGNDKMAEYISEDLRTSRTIVLFALLFHLIAVLMFISLLRWLAKPLVWLSIFGVIVGLIMLLSHTMEQYRFWRATPHAPQHDMNLTAQLQNIIQNYRFWQYVSIVLGAALTIIVLIVIVIRNRIAIAIAIVKETSKAITSIKSSILFPLIPGLFYILITVFAAVVILYLNSIGDFTYRLYKQLNSTSTSLEQCVCSGPAVSYKLLEKCNPEIFESNCHIANSGKACVETVCRFVNVQKSPQTEWLIYFCIFGYLWMTFFVSAYGEMVLACTFSMWYWTHDKKKLTRTPVLKAMGITTLYHLGTIAFGSLVLSICRMIRYILEVIERKAKLYNNSVTRAIICCMQCFFWLLENFLRFLNRNAYITCAIHSTSFCESSKKAFTLITQNILRMYAVDKVSDFLFFLSSLLLTGCTSFASYTFLIKYPNVIKVHNPLVPTVIVALLAYIMAQIVFSTCSMAVDTLFFCFLEDSNENDGSPQKPFYMSKQLSKVLGKRKNLQSSRNLKK